MKERPILFSAPMVKAILAGTKTQTRRIVASKNGLVRVPGTRESIYLDRLFGLSWKPFAGSPIKPWPSERLGEVSPYGGPGDRLWVKETWRPDVVRSMLGGSRDVEVLYAADGTTWTHFDVAPGWSVPRAALRGNVTPLFMPRWASRLTLEITDVRVERLQAITAGDITAEGIGAVDYSVNERPDVLEAEQRSAFVELWDSINGESAAWASNPWVWVVSFKRVESARKGAAA